MPKTVKPHHTSEWKIVRRKVLLRDNYVCQHCGVQLRRPGSAVGAPPHVDHVIPWSKGGAPFDMTNCVASCATCNLRKGARLAARRRRGRGPFLRAPAVHRPNSGQISPRGTKPRKRRSRAW